MEEQKSFNEEQLSFEAKTDLLKTTSIFSLIRSCGSRCQIFNPASDLAVSSARECYNSCVDIYLTLHAKYNN